MGKHPKTKKGGEKPQEATLPILTKLSSVTADDRAWACASLGNLLLHPADDDGVRLQLLKNNVVGKLIQTLTDETMDVVLEAAGALHSALIGEPDEPDGLLADMFRKDILTPLLALAPKLRTELRGLVHPKPVDVEMEDAAADKKKKKKKAPMDTSGDSFKLYTRLAQQVTALLQALAESSDTLNTKHTPLRIISLNSHVIPFLVDLADGFKGTGRLSVPAEVSQLALQTLLTLVQDNADACDLILSAGANNNIVEKLFDLVATKKHHHAANSDWTAEEVDLEAKRLLSASVLFQVVFSDLKKSALDKSDMLTAIIRVASKALDPSAVAHDLAACEALIVRILASKNPMAEMGHLERLMEAVELRHVALELAVNVCAEKEHPARVHVEKPDIVDEIIPEFEAFPDAALPEEAIDDEMQVSSDEDEPEDASVIGLVRHHNLIHNVTQTISATESALKSLNHQLDARQFAKTLLRLDDESDQEEDATSPHAIAKLVVDYRTIVSGMFARSLAALHNLVAIQPKAFFVTLPAEYWTSLMNLLRESFQSPGTDEEHVAALLKDEEEWAEGQAAIMGTLWKIVQKTHRDEPSLQPPHQDVQFFLEILKRGSDSTVQSQAAAILGLLAQQQSNIQQNKAIGTSMVEVVEQLSKRELEPDELPLISELLNSLFDTYADKSYSYDAVFRQEHFGRRLQDAYYPLKASIKKIDGRKWPDQRLQADEAIMNLKSFITYKERELRK